MSGYSDSDRDEHYGPTDRHLDLDCNFRTLAYAYARNAPHGDFDAHLYCHPNGVADTFGDFDSDRHDGNAHGNPNSGWTDFDANNRGRDRHSDSRHFPNANGDTHGDGIPRIAHPHRDRNSQSGGERDTLGDSDFNRDSKRVRVGDTDGNGDTNAFQHSGSVRYPDIDGNPRCDGLAYAHCDTRSIRFAHIHANTRGDFHPILDCDFRRTHGDPCGDEHSDGA